MITVRLLNIFCCRFQDKLLFSILRISLKISRFFVYNVSVFKSCMKETCFKNAFHVSTCRYHVARSFVREAFSPTYHKQIN